MALLCKLNDFNVRISSPFYTFEIDSLKKLALELKELPKHKRSLAYLLNRFYFFYAEKQDLDIKRWGDKTPLNSMSVFQIKKVFQEAQFVHIIRNGVDVSYSYMNSGLKDYTTAALRWKGTVKFLQKFGRKFPEQYYELKYEELVTNPEKNVKNICAFLNIEFDPTMLAMNKNAGELGDVKYLSHHKNVYNEINDDSIGKGKRNFTEKKLAEVKLITDKMNDSLGY